MGVSEYIGARYVPQFAEPSEWNDVRTYEPLTIVLHEGNSYTSKQFVPRGVALTDSKYWAETGNFNAQVEGYREEALRLSNKRVFVFDNVTDMQNNSNNLKLNDVCICLNYRENDNNTQLFIINNDTPNSMNIVRVGQHSASMIIDDITPSCFGAYADGLNDDSQYINAAIEYASTKDNCVCFNKRRYYCAKSINIPYDDFTIYGKIPHAEYTPEIVFNENITNCVIASGFGFRADNLTIKTKDINSLNNTVGIILNRDTIDIDADITNCAFIHLNTGIDTYGRNINIIDCEFIECETGVNCNYFPNGGAIRGIVIKNNRFHSIGVLSRFAGTHSTGAGIKFPDKFNRSDWQACIIASNFFDYCNVMFSGCCLCLTFIDNRGFAIFGAGFESIASANTTSLDNIFPKIHNNYISMYGNDATYAIHLEHVSRVEISANSINGLFVNAIMLNSCNEALILGNYCFSNSTTLTELLNLQNANVVVLGQNYLNCPTENTICTFLKISGYASIYSFGNANTGNSNAIIANTTLTTINSNNNHVW